MATKETTTKAGVKEQTSGEPNNAPNPNIVKLKNGELLDTTGFVKNLHSLDGTVDEKDSDTEWETLHIDRRFYNPNFCADFGGVEGYIIDIEQGQSDIAKDPNKNPLGLFDMIVIRATAPFPYCNEKGEVFAGKVGEDVILVMTDRLKKLELLNRDPDRVARVRLRPLEKIQIAKNKHFLWRWEAEMSNKFYDRSSIGAEYGLLKSLGDGSRSKILHALMQNNPDANKPASSMPAGSSATA